MKQPFDNYETKALHLFAIGLIVATVTFLVVKELLELL